MASASRPTDGQIPFDFSNPESADTSNTAPSQPGTASNQLTAPQPGTPEFAAARQAEIDDREASGGVYGYYGNYNN